MRHWDLHIHVQGRSRPRCPRMLCLVLDHLCRDSFLLDNGIQDLCHFQKVSDSHVSFVLSENLSSFCIQLCLMDFQKCLYIFLCCRNNRTDILLGKFGIFFLVLDYAQQLLQYRYHDPTLRLHSSFGFPPIFYVYHYFSTPLMADKPYS